MRNAFNSVSQHTTQYFEHVSCSYIPITKQQQQQQQQLNRLKNCCHEFSSVMGSGNIPITF